MSAIPERGSVARPIRTSRTQRRGAPDVPHGRRTLGHRRGRDRLGAAAVRNPRAYLSSPCGEALVGHVGKHPAEVQLWLVCFVRPSSDLNRADIDLWDTRVTNGANRTAPHHSGYAGPGQRTTTHGTRLAGRIQRRSVPALIAMASDVVIDRYRLTVQHRTLRAPVDAPPEHLTGRVIDDHCPEGVGSIATRHVNSKLHELLVDAQLLGAGRDRKQPVRSLLGLRIGVE